MLIIFPYKKHESQNETYVANVKSLACNSYKLTKQQVFTRRDLCTIWDTISEYMSRKGAPLNVQCKDNIRE